MSSDKTIVLLTGGGSGGHIYPLLAVGESLKRSANENKFDLELHYFGPANEGADVLNQIGAIPHSIISGKLRRYFSLQNVLDIPKFFIGLVQAFFKIFWLMPDVIFSKGGPGALPVVFSGWFYRIPIVVHESDATPGLTTLVSSPFAKRIALSFENAMKFFDPSKTSLTGNPVREDLLTNRPSEDSAKAELGFKSDQPLILFLGGSQGSQRINEFVIVNLGDILKESQVLHQTGQANYNEVKKLVQAALLDISVEKELQSRYQPVAYFENSMKTAFAACDLVVARAGSGEIFEIAAFGKPSIMIPLLESANDHQRLNAYEFAKTGAAVVIEENNLLPAIFLGQVRTILGDQNLAQKMSMAADKFFKPDAAKKIAEEILSLA